MKNRQTGKRSQTPPKARTTRQPKVDPRVRLAYNIEVTEEAIKRTEERGGRRPPTNRFTEQKGAEFIRHLREGATVVLAAHLVGLSRTTLYQKRVEDPEFSSAWDVAYEQGTDALEAEAERRAVKGVTKPVYHKGEVCGHVQEFSDILLIFLLKARRPEKFRDRVDLSNKDGSIGAGLAAAVRKAAS